MTTIKRRLQQSSSSPRTKSQRIRKSVISASIALALVLAAYSTQTSVRFGTISSRSSPRKTPGAFNTSLPEQSSHTQIIDDKNPSPDHHEILQPLNDTANETKEPYPTSVLPAKLFTVIGLESSGTTFLAQTLGRALRLSLIPNANGYEVIAQGFSSHYHNHHNNDNTPPHWTEVQHVSLPWGGTCQSQYSNNVTNVLYPAICTRMMRDRSVVVAKAGPKALSQGPFAAHHFSETALSYYRIPPEQHETMRQQCRHLIPDRHQWDYPERYLLNLSSHLDWYHEQGVDARAIILMRDATISKRARRIDHCPNTTLLEMEETMGRQILQEAIRKFVLRPTTTISGQQRRRQLLQASPNGKVLLVSYELLTQLKQDYMEIIFAQLGINTTHRPRWRDGNYKHVKDIREHRLANGAYFLDPSQ
ncbi:expressed unknown protein [Seminavis robusta]|uniref:Sulfotransferase n=1 Tax=Seminavis robusta TaxID=568900 RepID=A0A9N8HPA9_9STRA|nr:expressed unknown protein [Seminavis robusta]|eukprot:Sro1308_g261460.1 n/a (419) ;mRNA; f:13139-14395